MKLLIDEDRLRVLLAENKEKIGHEKVDGFDDILSAISLFLSGVTGTYGMAGSFEDKLIKGSVLFLSALFLTWGCYLMVKSIMNQYGHEQLYSDIKDMNEVTHPFSLIAIKNSFEKFPNQFLLYFDNKWDCWFFPNYATKDKEEDNRNNIVERISNELKVEKSDIQIQLTGERTQIKYSPSDDQKKCYNHKLYQVDFPFTKALQLKQFEIDGKLFRWMSPEEMRKNDKIRERNLEVVDFVTETIG